MFVMFPKEQSPNVKPALAKNNEKRKSTEVQWSLENSQNSGWQWQYTDVQTADNFLVAYAYQLLPDKLKFVQMTLLLE